MLLKKRVANITTRKPSLARRLRDEIQGTPEENGLLPDGTIEQIIKDASRIILGADYNRLKIKDKAGNANFVTEYDVKTQRFLMESFKALMPDCEFLAEEDDGDSNSVSDGYTFVIDPIDGTTNFMLDRRASCISVGLLKNKKPVYGAIFDPYTNRFFSAHVGKGAYCNHRPICVSDRTPSVGIADATVVVENIYPNPTTGRITVSTRRSAEATLFDISGRSVAVYSLNAGTNVLDLTAFQNGVYMLRVDGAVSKIVKK
jgi:fructose-1,6-bisphosphatase/inositol monophosphatase family enzyme